MVAVLGGQTDRVRDGVGLGRRELGVGEGAGDGVRVEHAPPILSPKTPTPKGADRDAGELERETFDLPPPARDLLRHHDFRVPPRRSLARGYRVRLSRDERVPPGLGGELVQLLHQIPLALVLPRQQPVLVKLAGARLTQNPLGKRFLRRRRRRNACRLAAHCRISVPRGVQSARTSCPAARVPRSARGDPTSCSG